MNTQRLRIQYECGGQGSKMTIIDTKNRGRGLRLLFLDVFTRPSPKPDLAGVFDRPALPDDHDLDLAGIHQAILDLLHYVAGHLGRKNVVDRVWLNHDTDFSACLNGEALLNAVKFAGDLLQRFQAFHVVLHGVLAGAGPGRADGVGGGYDDASVLVITSS